MLRLRLTFRQWSEAVDGGYMPILRAHLAERERLLEERIDALLLDLSYYGTAFTVDGVRVPPERVMLRP